VGEFAFGLLGQLPNDRVEVDAFAISWRRRHQLSEQLPNCIGFIDKAMPARPLHAVWDRADVLRLERLIGPAYAVVHGSNFFVPPTKAVRFVTVHDLTPKHFPEMCMPTVLRYPSYIQRYVDEGVYIHTPTEFVKNELIEIFGASKDRVVAIHHGIPTDAYLDSESVSEEFISKLDNYAKGKKIVLAVGTIEPRKGLVGFLDAFDEIQRSRSDVVFVVAGSKGWGWQPFEAKMKSLSNPGSVLVLGWVSDAERKWLYRRSEVLIFPSLYEGFGLPVLEAMSHGLPVVHSDAGAVVEVAGGAGYKVVGRERSSWVLALERVLDDERVRDQLRSAGFERASGFTWAVAAEKMRKAYLSALDMHN